MKQVTTTVLREVITERRKQVVRNKPVGDTAIRRDLAFVSSVFTLALETEEEWTEGFEHPVHRLSKTTTKNKRLKRTTRRRRFFSPREFGALLCACTTQQQRRILKLAVSTGMRRQEIENLQWERNVRLSRREIVLWDDDTKTSEPRTIALNDIAVRVLSLTVRSNQCPYVFWHMEIDEKGRPVPVKYASFAQWWKGVKKRAIARSPDSRFHDLRRTFASWWIQRGGDWEVLRTMLGHSQSEMTANYAYLRTGDLHDEIARLSGPQPGQDLLIDDEEEDDEDE
ncbi:hypothetical protein P409_00660 [Inquilinus limosus MP06]|uniref:Tyr recombinase domain-containing protein n=2 Tax=Inquilinus limosus TaxID=171674 RepID=A0A0A0DDR9_9PROT|nr:hypothetical protein P409_00660 [Inquilinus limosus MP06]